LQGQKARSRDACKKELDQEKKPSFSRKKPVRKIAKLTKEKKKRGTAYVRRAQEEENALGREYCGNSSEVVGKGVEEEGQREMEKKGFLALDRRAVRADAEKGREKRPQRKKKKEKCFF